MTDSSPNIWTGSPALSSGLLSNEFTLMESVKETERSLIEVDALSVAPTGIDRVNILGIGAMPLDLDKAAATLERWRTEGQRKYVCVISVHGLVVAQRDPAIRSALNGCGMATEDGMPLVWWSRLAGFAQARRVCGSDLLDTVCAYGLQRGYRHYFYGASPKVLGLLTDRLQQRYPGLIVAGSHSPPFRPLTPEEDAEDIAAINRARPDFVWVGLGMPKQERWMVDHLGKVNATALVGIGAAFDFHAGTKPRAPIWMQRSGLEWLFRLTTEPQRLAHRYLIDNALFISHMIQQVTGWKTYARDW
jgi:N-acetylglucosaminyldiphosphoundecaprenol N-acetyl-beta-D-mannosaminyltransferase